MISEPRPLLRADARYRKRSIECKFGLVLSPAIPCWSPCLHFSGCDSMHMCLALFPTSFVDLLSTDSTFVPCHSLPGLPGNLGSFNSFSHHCDKARWQKQHRNLFWFIFHKGQSIMPGESWWMEAIEPVVEEDEAAGFITLTFSKQSWMWSRSAHKTPSPSSSVSPARLYL